MTTITLPRAVVEQALETIEGLTRDRLFTAEWAGKHGATITALRAALAHQAEPVRLQQMADAGFKPRDRRLECDECGGKFTAQMLPIHKCAQQAEPVEPVAWKQGNLVTFNEDPYPALGGLFVQFWDGEEVAARVYANDLETIRQRCAKVYTAPPQRKLVPLTEEEIERIGMKHVTLREVIRAVERAHGIKE